MKIKVSNLGHVQSAELTLSDFTIVCGNNNTGKTYLSYVIGEFFSYWWEEYELDLGDRMIDPLFEKGNVSVTLENLLDKGQDFVNAACESYSKKIKKVLTTEQESMSKAKLEIKIEKNDLSPLDTFKRTMGAKGDVFSILKDKGSNTISISLLVDRNSVEIPKRVLARSIGDAIKEIIFASTFPMPTILPAERTGIEMFQTELDFARSKVLDTLKDEEGEIDPFLILDRVDKDYAMPIDRAIGAVRGIGKTVQKMSYIANKHPHIIKSMNLIIGGDVLYSNRVLYFIPEGDEQIRLTIRESSSSVRSLVDLVIYLKHGAQKGDILMIDEPELNLHPENQRKLTRLFAQIANAGIKVYITTHSDYIVKELNNLTLISVISKKDKAKLFKEYGYVETELIKREKCAVYIASELSKDDDRRTHRYTFEEAEYRFAGFKLDDFDKAINEMNNIQDYLFYGD